MNLAELTKEIKHEKKNKVGKGRKKKTSKGIPSLNYFLTVRGGRGCANNKEMYLKQNCQNYDKE